jgi:NAD(P)-dependent dehydrogenase (short-subunit alcohol dehydrogenase family)
LDPLVAPSFDLTGRVALVTGGTKGIGYGIVRQFLKAGAKVTLTSRTAADCVAVAGSLGEEFGDDRVLGVACDLTDIDAMPALLDAALERFGRIDDLVPNAALTGGHGPLESASLELFDRMLHTNVVCNFALARLVAPLMVEQNDGSITFVTSIAAVTPMPTNIAYAASKSALTSVALSLAAAYAGTGLRVNCVQPGLIRSFSSEAAFGDEEKLRSYSRANIPLGRIGEAEEIGAACVYLASSAGGYLSGEVIPVDGGRTRLGAVAARPT